MLLWIAATVAVVAGLGGGLVLAIRWYNTEDDDQDNLAVLVPGGLEMRRALETGDAQPVVAHLARVSDDVSARFEVVHLVATAAALVPVRSAAERAPDDAFLAMVQGACGIRAAWEARGSGLADSVDESAWPQFFAHLEAAQDSLTRAAELAPDDPTPFAFLITVGKGLQLDGEDVRAYLDAAHDRSSGFYPAFRNAMDARSEKWGGSHDEALALAREAAEAVPLGHPAKGLPLFGHLLIWQWHSSIQEDATAARAYLRKLDVLTECRQAVDESILHPDARASMAMNQVANDAAYLFASGDHERDAKRMFRAIGDRWTASPWYFESARPGVAYRLSRWVDT